VFKLLGPATPPRQCVELVGNEVLSYRHMLACYRRAMGFAPALQVSIPARIVGWTAAIVGLLPGAILTPDTWTMLQQGNTRMRGQRRHLLGHPPRGVAGFIEPTRLPPCASRALAAWRAPLLRAVLAAVWSVTGLISMLPIRCPTA